MQRWERQEDELRKVSVQEIHPRGPSLRMCITHPSHSLRQDRRDNGDDGDSDGDNDDDGDNGYDGDSDGSDGDDDDVKALR